MTMFEVGECLQSFGAESFVSSLLSRNVKIKMYRTIMLSVVSHRCKTWSLTSREKRRLRVFEKRVLRRMFGPERDG